ncbi:amidase signature domain-containing protein [Fusarium flagelliforme]|uniref:amidase signature domain-containing protein n=1 Tax=Fusarium flagelliforme TaxID=2675880 RepID=UPI001E8D5D2C|nr:amidase signature domain-containing protein [Fusarium flagelliforme]KAH7179331.1 amidase signature domain-containing protein [Fusarium flagelliforme]
MATKNWEEVAAQKRQKQAEDIAAFVSAELSDAEQQREYHSSITGIDNITLLAEKIGQGEYSSEEVTKAYISRAIEAHKRTNCLTEILFKDALAQARELDEYYTKEGKTKGPFHGIPISLKDQFNVKGHDTTLGYTGRSFKPASEDAVLVNILKKLGAVVICKTNLPQSIMWAETDNPLWGLTENPIIPGYTPGGSTGGESALLYSQGSLVGFGSDLGGSIRMPAHLMGLYGFKPSSPRLPYYGVPVTTDGQEHVPSSIGPLARSMSSIHDVTKEIILQEPWTQDCRCVPIPWRQNAYDDVLNRKLTIGIIRDDGVVKPHPTISRVLEETVTALRSAGHEVIEWIPDRHAEVIEVMDAYFTVDGLEDVRRDVEVGGEPFITAVQTLVDRGKAISVFEYWQLNKRKRELQQAYLEKWNNSISEKTGRVVDALITPALVHAAVPHNSIKWVGYTKVWNLLDYTALVIPAGTVEPQDLGAKWDHESRNEKDEWCKKLWEEKKEEMAKHQLPVDIQIVGRHLEEEKVLAIGKVIDDLLRSRSQ